MQLIRWMPEQMAHQLNVLWCQEITVFDRTHISLLEFEVLLGVLAGCIYDCQAEYKHCCSMVKTAPSSLDARRATELPQHAICVHVQCYKLTGDYSGCKPTMKNLG